jgi:predicted nuclease with TOPRIM domain
MANNKKVILIALLAGITIFSGYKYYVSLREQYDLKKQMGQMKDILNLLQGDKLRLLQTLEKEKAYQQKLDQENNELKGTLKSSEDKIIKLEDNLSQVQKNAEKLMTTLQSENADLKVEKEKMSSDFSRISQENEAFKLRLGSVVELKKAIRELRVQVHKVDKQIKQKVSKDKAEAGNQGFVVKDGRSTFPAKIKIEVIPASSQ